jgi:hypothetical protein
VCQLNRVKVVLYFIEFAATGTLLPFERSNRINEEDQKQKARPTRRRHQAALERNKEIQRKRLPPMDPDAFSNKGLPTYKDQVRGDRAESAEEAGPRGVGIDGGGNNNVQEEDGGQRVVQVDQRPTQHVSELTTSGSEVFLTDDDYDAAGVTTPCRNNNHHMMHHQEPPMIIVQAVEVLARHHDGEDSAAARAGTGTTTLPSPGREAPGALNNNSSNVPKPTCGGAYYSWQSMTFVVFGCIFIVGGLIFGCVAQGYCKKPSSVTTPTVASAVPAVVVASPAPTPLQTLSPVWDTVWNDGNWTDRINRTQDVDVLLRWEHSVSGTNNQSFDETAQNDLEAVISTTVDAYIENSRNTLLWPFNLTRVSVETVAMKVWGETLLETTHVVEVSYRSIPIQDMAVWVRGALTDDESLLRRLQNTNERFAAVRSLDVAVDGIRITESAPPSGAIQLSGAAAFHHHHRPATCLYAMTLGALLHAVV